MNSGSKVESCTAGIECSVDTKKDGIVNSIEEEGDDTSDRYVDMFLVRSDDGLMYAGRLNGSLGSYTTVGSGGSVIGRLIAVDASSSDDTIRLHIGSLVSSIAKRVVNSNDVEVEDTVGYCVVVEIDDGLVDLAWNSESPSIGNELNVIDTTIGETAESVEMKSEQMICSNCTDEISGTNLAWNRSGLGTMLEVEYIVCIPLNVSSDTDKVESTERSANSRFGLDYRSSSTEGTIFGTIVGAEIYAWMDSEMKRVHMKEYDCRFAILSDGKQQCVADIRSAECGNSSDEMYTVEDTVEKTVEDTDTNLVVGRNALERSAYVMIVMLMVLLLMVSIENECRRIREYVTNMTNGMLYIREVLDSISKRMFVYDIGEYLYRICDGKGYKSKDYWNEKSEEAIEHCASEMLEQGRVSECAQSLISCIRNTRDFLVLCRL